MEATSADRQRIVDEEHLRLLALFHYISGAVTIAFSLFIGVWIVFMGTMLAFVPPVPPGGEAAGAPHPHAPFAIMLAFFGVFFALGLAYGILEILSGRYIARRRRRVFSLVVAVPRILLIPYGTILSIVTLLVLDRTSIKALYRETAR
jgi:hypothetical protein